VIRKRGKKQFIEGTNKVKIATGDCIRGQLHDETFFGAIKLGLKDENGRLLKDENGNFKQEKNPIYVVRVPLKYKKTESDSGFRNINEIEKVIVDKHLFAQIKKQVIEADNSLQKAIENGIYMFNGKGEKENKIRHIRIEKSVTEPLKIKKQTYLSKHEYKQYYYAGNASNPYYVLYQGIVKNKIERKYKIVNLFDTSKLKENGKLNVLDSVYYDKNETIKLPLYTILEIGQKVLFFKESPDEFLEMDINNLNKRMYIITGFEKDGRIRFLFHKEAREDKKLTEDFPKDKFDEFGNKYGESGKNGFSFLNWENPWPKLKISIGNLNILIEGKDFIIMPDGKISIK
jgi:CRISPR-associated endonuclease Csn1